MLAAAPDMSAGHLTLSRYASDRRNIGTIIVGASPGSRPRFTNKIMRGRAPRRGEMDGHLPLQSADYNATGSPVAQG